MTELHLELLLGKKVLDENGAVVGHIEEVIADERDGACLVTEFHLGPAALLERLAAVAGAVPLLGALARRRGVRVPWRRLNLDDPEHPRLVGRRADLEEL